MKSYCSLCDPSSLYGDVINLIFLFVSTEEEEEEEEDEEEVKDRTQPRGTIWLDVESSREATDWLPWRPDKAKGQSEEDCEDPDRQVMCLIVLRQNILFVELYHVG